MIIDDPDEPLFSVRFAIDIALIAQSRGDIAKMLGHFQVEARKYGLAMNMAKTKVLATAAVTETFLYPLP